MAQHVKATVTKVEEFTGGGRELTPASCSQTSTPGILAGVYRGVPLESKHTQMNSLLN